MSSPGSQPAEALARKPLQLPTFGGKYFALAVLFTINLLNYVDRYAFVAAGPHIKQDFAIKNELFGWLIASFMIVYTIVSPFVGWLGDRYNRKALIAGGVGLWSLATVGTAFSSDYTHMFFWRALLGIGEASYGVIAPTLLADLFPVKERGRAMGLYYLALPVGTAVGMILGGTIADAFGWRAVFWVVGLPGLLAAGAGLWMRDPGRGAAEGRAQVGAADRPALRDYLELFRTRTFVYNTAGMSAVTFAIGAYGAWGLMFYENVHRLTPTQASITIGGLMVVASMIGIAMGAFVADAVFKLTKRAYLLVAAFAVMTATPLGAIGILDPVYKQSLVYLFLASLLMSMVLGPCNTVIANVVPANRRAVAFATFIFLMHLFGDISSQVLLGWISDLFGDPKVMASPLGRFFASIGATPVNNTNLTVAMLSVVPVLVLACVLFLIGSRYLPADQERVRAAGGSAEEGAASFHH
jgi:MFS transporter, Spinster family, sphingosine-1-phosphate transporter